MKLSAWFSGTCNLVFIVPKMVEELKSVNSCVGNEKVNLSL
jgi:hypothetical protein